MDKEQFLRNIQEEDNNSLRTGAANRILQLLQCIFRKNCASVPEERSAIPLQTEQSSAG